MRINLIGAALLTTACGATHAQPNPSQLGVEPLRMSEILVNPAGADDGREFIEISGPTNTPLDGLWIVVIDGDGSEAGTIDQALPLDGFQTDADGIFLWRDAAGVIDNSREPGVQGPGVAFPSLQVQDFDPDLENGSNTFLIVQGFTGAAGIDLDTDDDGTLDAQPWSLVLFALSWTDGGAGDGQYAGQLGGFDLQPVGFAPNAYLLDPGGLAYFFQVTGGNANGPDWNLISPSTNFISPAPDPLPREAVFMNPGVRFPPRLCADQNLDALVTPADFNAWILNFNAQSPFADANMDGQVTPADFNAWILVYNQGQAGPACTP